ncbi:hypothetical protein EAF00_004972 [Botryotinia globosa]|nr:hypothetical protein EAF00_004972 [Botryotinia globosa]
MESVNTPVLRQPGVPLLKRSHSGCRDCRVRKVKCDEVKPVCSNCRRRYINISQCDWSTGSQKSQKSAVQRFPTPTIPAPRSSLETYPNTLADTTSQWRSLELRLMYHYSTIVSHLMPACQGAPARAWQHIIPRLSFDSEIVLNPMLALSALHLHTHTPQDSLISIALRRYLDRTLVNHRQALSEGEELSEQLWLSVILLCHVYWLLSRQKLENEEYEIPVQAIKMLEGVNVVFNQKRRFLDRLGYAPYKFESLPSVLSQDELSGNAKLQMSRIEEDLDYLINAFSVSTESETIQSVYLEAKESVLFHYRAFFSGTSAQILRRMVTVMSARCQLPFRVLLEHHDPLAMALWARVLVLLKGLEYAWWVNGGGEYEVVEKDVRGIRGLMPKKFRWTMNWPFKVLEGEIILERAPVSLE